jgi:hypothetical protein
MLGFLWRVASLALLATAQTEGRIVTVYSRQPFKPPNLQSGRAIDSAYPTANLPANRDAGPPRGLRQHACQERAHRHDLFDIDAVRDRIRVKLNRVAAL